MNDEQHIDKDKQMMGVPESIESSEPVKGFRELHQATPEPSGGKSEGDYHA